MQILAMGKPAILSDDGRELSVRGHQAWAILVRLLASSRPISRRVLASEVFPEAEDPLGALRWCLAALRRCLGAETLRGDPVELNLPEHTFVDIFEVDSDAFDFERAGDLLEGMTPATTPAFSTWLLIERERLRNRLSASARRCAIASISARDFERAMQLANVCIRLAPSEEGGHILLVKALALAGRHEAAVAHVEATEREFLREFGVPPSPALRSAARPTIEAPPIGVSASSVAETQIAAGKAALDAGALEAGIDSLRRAAAGSQKQGDKYLEARALLELGTALVHTVRGYDDEGAVILRQASEAAHACGSADVAASALRELGYVDALAGRRPSAEILLDEALVCADEDADALAGVHSIIGFNLVDWGRYEEGLGQFRVAIEQSRSAGSVRKEAWALGIGAWGFIRSGNFEDARSWLRDCIEICERIRWISFRLWAQSAALEAELAGSGGLVSTVEAEKVFALSCQIGDPCWEAAGARVLALQVDATGEPRAALDWLAEASRRNTRVTDTWAGLHAAILADRARISRKVGKTEDAAIFTRQLIEFAAKTHADGYLREAMAWLA